MQVQDPGILDYGRLYWAVFAAAFMVIGLWEVFRQRCVLRLPTYRRWATNAALGVIGSFAAHALYPASAIVLSWKLYAEGWGLIPRSMLPFPVQVAIGFLMLDFVRYGAHYLLHHITPLWRLHRVHHSDPDLDLTLALRFHPFEALLIRASMLGAIALAAPPPLAIIAGELVTVVLNFLGHANVRLGERFERWARLIVITPDLHRIHHSADAVDYNKNYGSVFSIWDRLFRTLLENPAAGHAGIRFGLPGLEIKETLSLPAQLLLPFRRTVDAEPSPERADVNSKPGHHLPLEPSP